MKLRGKKKCRDLGRKVDSQEMVQRLMNDVDNIFAVNCFVRTFTVKQTAALPFRVSYIT